MSAYLIKRFLDFGAHHCIGPEGRHQERGRFCLWILRLAESNWYGIGPTVIVVSDKVISARDFATRTELSTKSRMRVVDTSVESKRVKFRIQGLWVETVPTFRSLFPFRRVLVHGAYPHPTSASAKAVPMCLERKLPS